MAVLGKRKRIRQQLKQAHGFVDPKYLASCYGKIRRTKEQAYAEASERPTIVKAYRCRFCNDFHIGRRK